KEVRRILREERGAPVPIYAFAHCVGAVGLQMAILQGKLGAEDLAAVCFNAIHPWIIPSPTNIVRSKLGAFTRDWISNELLDPILESREEVTAAQTMFDRLAFSVARYEEDKTERHGSLHGFWPDGGRNLSNAICDRMTLLYGRMWQHENLEKKLHQGWQDLVGEAPAEVMQQLNYMLERRRLLDDQGQ